MKTLFALLLPITLLGGCVVLPVDGHRHHGYYRYDAPPPAVVVPAPRPGYGPGPGYGRGWDRRGW
ncbi:MAG: hypothetical protein J0L85_04355 [Zoogloea sp.]|jgi:hypothetical protein|nr:hypothetical protein [Zoogloea sp.]MCA0189130.1 hypothetical protein [Pseudomonadota bacterium]